MIYIPVGKIGSGKSTVSEYLATQLDAVRVSCSEVLRDYVSTELNNPNYTRVDLQNAGDGLRKQFGPGVLAKRALEAVENYQDKNLILDSVHNPGEITQVQELVGKENVLVIGLTVDEETRLHRIYERHAAYDVSASVDFETWKQAFLTVDERDNGKQAQAFQLNNDACVELADVVIENNGKVDDLYKELENYLER